MPESSHVEAMLRDALDAIQGMDKMLRGNGGPGLGEQVRNNTRAIERLQNSVDMLLRSGPDPDLSKTRWRAIGEIAIAAVAVTSLIMNLLGG